MNFLPKFFNRFVTNSEQPSEIPKSRLPAPRPGIFFVYAIQCDNGSIYIGQTEDLTKRWQEHCVGGVNWTKQHKPIEIVYWEEFQSREEAVKREHDLKTGFGRKWLKRLVASRLRADLSACNAQVDTHGQARQAGDISAPKNRDTKQEKLVMESLSCPYCQSTTFVKKGIRVKKREKVQLYRCSSCHKVFTPRLTKGKQYPLNVMLDAISIYNLGYSLEQACKIVNERQSFDKTQDKQKSRLSNAAFSTGKHTDVVVPALSENNITDINVSVNSKKGVIKNGVDPRGVEPLLPAVTEQVPHRRGPTQNSFYSLAIQPSTLSNWLEETK